MAASLRPTREAISLRRVRPEAIARRTGEADAVLAQVGVLAEEEAGLLPQQAVGGEDLALDVLLHGRGRIERLQVVGDAAERGVGADQILGGPAGRKCLTSSNGNGWRCSEPVRLP